MVLDQVHAYQAGGAVYFDVSSFPDFGSVSGYTRAQMLGFAAERGGNVDDPHKRHPLDFVLWQPSLDDAPPWQSLWVPAPPALPLQCPALALPLLGTPHYFTRGCPTLFFPHLPSPRYLADPFFGYLFF